MARKGIYKRGDTWWIRYAGLDGKIIRKSARTEKYKDAELMLHTEKKAVEDGKQPVTKRIANYTFNELKDRYVAWMQGRHKSADTKTYRIKQMASRFGSLSLRHFNTMLVEQFQTDLTNKGLKPASVNKEIAILKAMFAKAVEWEMVEEETLKRVRKVKLFKESNKRLRFLSVEETQGLISVCDEHLKPIVLTALHTGMRRGEILGLEWQQVDLQHGFILLTNTKNGERREIPIDNTVRAVLHTLPRRIDCPYVFHDLKTLKRYKAVKRSFHTALERAKITDFHFHDLRHTFASHLIMSGVDLTTVKELLGHKDIKMTLRYSHLAPAHKRNAINVLDTLLNQPTTAQHSPTAQKLTHEIKKESAEFANSLNLMVGATGIEPVAPAV